MLENVLTMSIPSSSLKYVPFDRLNNVFQFKFSSAVHILLLLLVLLFNSHTLSSLLNKIHLSEMILLSKLMRVQSGTSYELTHDSTKSTTFI